MRRRRSTLAFSACLNLLLLAAPLVFGQQAEQELYQRLNPTGYVNDFAGVFKPEQRQDLEQFLNELDRKTTSQVSVVTVKSLEGGEIQDFANRLFERWGIGQKGKDNGVLLIAAIQDRKAWIEVGYGLEPVIPDARAGRILDEYVIPYFKQGDYGTGLSEGARAIAAIVAQQAGVQLEGAPQPANPPPGRGGGQGIGWPGIILIVILILVFARHPFLFLLILQALLGGGGGGRRGGGFGGGGFGGGGFGGFGGGSSGGGGAGRSW